MYVLGTAGHIDHGKSSLLRALTGMEPSRLPEERRRGMTMQLGYVHFTDADGRKVGVVDVPGHADYRQQALAGLGVVDAFLFTCALDDGWMPQSEEHLFALAAYRVRHGVVVLTKRDLVDAARFTEVRQEMEVRFYEALGREVPVVSFSAKDASGLAELKAALYGELQELGPSRDRDRPVMHVDRVFSVAGQGTVVTGTLREGALAERDVIEILPIGKKAQVRSLQTYGARVAHAAPNTRVAVQLAQLSVADIPKDAQLRKPQDVFLTATVDAAMQAFGDYHIRAAKNPQVILLHGGVRTAARLVATRSQADGGFIRLRLLKPRCLRFDEALLILSCGGDRVLGAAAVLDEKPCTAINAAALHIEKTLHFDRSLPSYLAMQVSKLGYLRLDDILRRTMFTSADLDAAMGQQGALQVLGGWLTTPERIAADKCRLTELIATHHLRYPADDGVAESALRKATRFQVDVLRVLLCALKKDRKIDQVGPYLRTLGFVPRADQMGEVATVLAAAADDPSPVVRSYFELGLDTEAKRKLLARLVAEGRFVRMDERHVMAAPAFRAVSRDIAALIRDQGSVSAKTVRDHLQIGRKIVIMVLEAMDHAKVTVRDGDLRRLVGDSF